MAILNEFSGLLYLFISGYLIWRFACMLAHHDRQWVLRAFAISFLLVISSYAVQRGWAGFTRFLAPDGQPFNTFMDDNRGLVNSITAGIFTIGVYMFESEIMEIKHHKKRLGIYTGLVGAAVFLVWI